jgi:hypothetical protein
MIRLDAEWTQLMKNYEGWGSHPERVGHAA